MKLIICENCGRSNLSFVKTCKNCGSTLQKKEERAEILDDIKQYKESQRKEFIKKVIPFSCITAIIFMIAIIIKNSPVPDDTTLDTMEITTESNDTEEQTDNFYDDNFSYDKSLDVMEEMAYSRIYYKTALMEDIPQLAETENTVAVLAKLKEANERLSADCDKYLEYMDDPELSEYVREQCMNLKTGFYIVTTQAIIPMIDVFEGNSSNIPEYSKIVNTIYEAYVER